MTDAASFSNSPDGVDADACATVETALDALAALADVSPGALSADGLMHYVSLLGAVTRFVEGRQIDNVGEIERRSGRDTGFEGLAARHGCASVTSLFEKVTGIKNSTAYRYTRVARHTTTRLSDTGLPLPPRLPHTATALADGSIGLDAAEALSMALVPTLPRALPDEVDAAEKTLVGNATGVGGGAPVQPDCLRLQAQAFSAVLDPDGIEPSVERLHERRSLTFRPQDDGSMRVSGSLSPEQSAIITPVFDAYMSKRTSPTFMQPEELRDAGQELEKRTKAQERSDVFTAIIGGVGKQDSAPKLHGRGPTVLVTVRRDDVDAGRGTATSPGTPALLPLSFVAQAQCDGDTQEVTVDANGDVVALSSPGRFFTPAQRLALIARDGPTCAADDCAIPVWLTEAHHISGWSAGGRTEVSNGVMLCWFHHRLVERGEWTMRRDERGRPRLSPPAWYVSRGYMTRRNGRRDADERDDPGDSEPRS